VRTTTQRRAYLLCLSGKREADLEAKARVLRDWLLTEEHKATDLLDVSYTLWVGREHFDYRCCFIAEDQASAIALLESYLKHPKADDCYGDQHVDIELRKAAQTYLSRGVLEQAWLTPYFKNARRISLPTYPFERQSYWHDRKARQVRVEIESESSEVLLYQLKWQLKVLKERSSNTSWKRIVLIVTEKTQQQISGQLKKIDCLCVTPQTLVNLKKTEAWLSNQSSFDAIVHAVGLDKTAVGVENSFTPLFYLMQSLTNQRWQGEVSVVYRMDGIGQAYFGGLSGFLKTLSLENPMIKGRVIGLDEENADALHNILKQEQGSQETHVRYLLEARLSLEAAVLEKTAKAELKDISGKVYLISGGLGGLGRQFACEYVRLGAKVMLLGRSVLDANKLAQLSVLNEGQGIAEYYSCDIGDRASLKRCLEEIRGKHGKLSGVIHSAGVIRDGLLQSKAGEVAREVLRPKVEGTVNLEQLTREDGLECFVAFSSTSAIWGNAGQIDYTYANAFLDHYLSALQQTGMPYTIIHWPYWRDGGMSVAHASQEEFEQYLWRAFGLKGLNMEEGWLSYQMILRGHVDQVIVLKGNSDRIKQLFVPTVQINTVHVHAGDGVDRAMADSSVNRIRHILIESLCAVLELSEKSVNDNTVFQAYGMDSVSLTKYSELISTKLGITLMPNIFFSYASIDELLDYLKTQHNDIFDYREACTMTPIKTATPSPKQKNRKRKRK